MNNFVCALPKTCGVNHFWALQSLQVEAGFIWYFLILIYCDFICLLMWPESGLKVNTSYLRKTKIVPKQASSVTEGLSQNIVIEILSHCSLLQLLCGGVFQSIPYRYICIEALLHIWSYSGFQFAQIQKCNWLKTTVFLYKSAISIGNRL